MIKTVNSRVKKVSKEIKEVDFVVIGGGTAGLGAFRKASSLGAKGVIIEKTDFVTTCANVGCMPSKLLIAASSNVNSINKSSIFGIKSILDEVDAAAVFQRVRSERDRFVSFVRDSAYKIDADKRVFGECRILGPNLVECDSALYKTKAIIIATGSSAVVPQMFEAVRGNARVMTNDSVFNLSEIPKRLCVVGAGAIGLEMAFAFKSLGSEVVIITQPNASIASTSVEVSKSIETFLELSHIKLLKTNITSVEAKKELIVITAQKVGLNGQAESLSHNFSHVLIASGRRANLDGFGLDSVVDLSASGLEYAKSNLKFEGSNIYICGDANSGGLLHTAADQGVLAASRMCYDLKISDIEPKEKMGVDLKIAFTPYQIFSCGEALGPGQVVGRVDFSDQGRSRVDGLNYGLLELYVQRGSRKITGASGFAPQGEHIAHALAWVISMGVSIDEFLELPFYHPSVFEGVRTAARDALSQLD